MDYRSLHMKTVTELRQLAKDTGVKFPAGIRKEDMIARILEKEASDAANTAVAAEKPVPETKQSEKNEREKLVSEPKRTERKESEKPVTEPKQPEKQDSKKPAVEPKLESEKLIGQSGKPVGQNGEQPSAEKKAEPVPKPAAAEPHIYRRPLSTQQRMGARTQPAQNAYRAQPAKPGMQTGRTQNRFAQDGGPRSQRGFGVRQREPRNGEQRIPELKTAETREPRAAEPNAAEQRTTEQKMTEARVVEPRMPQESESLRRAAQPEETAEGMRTVNPAVPDLLAAGDCGDGEGILEIHQEGYGFLRAENYLPGNRDVYVSAAQIRRFNLRTGDYVAGKTRAQQTGDRSVGLIFINEVNGQSPDMARNRRPFDSLIPVYPDQRLRMEDAGQTEISLRLIDLIAPVGKGQRGMIVSPPKAGKTTLLKKIANAITANNPDVHLIVLLIDERPEEVTDMKRSIQGEVVYSTFDEAPENHTRVSEMVLERAQRLVELGKDVVVLLDSITRLARAYNLVIPPTGRSLSGGLDPGALHKPKRFFGAARNIENGGSLTVIATALVDTGSRMDDIIFEEFKGTGNMELHLDRSLSDRRIFPAIDLYKSGTRREELLLSKAELDAAYQMRKILSRGTAQESAEQLISMMEKTRTNEEFCQKLKGWMNVYEKDGFILK